jgi:hypothetical protein
LSDYIVRLNRRENTQLDLRLRQIKRQETIVRRSYEREIYWKRLQLAQIYEDLNESFDDSKSNRASTAGSFYSIRMRRNQSAPPNTRRRQPSSQPSSRPNTTPTAIRYSKLAMSVFKEITIKPPHRTLNNLLVLLDNDPEKSQNNEWPMRSRTMISLKTPY